MDRYHIIWLGTYTERILKTITRINPDKIIFLMDAKSEDWSNFQNELLNDIGNYLGKIYFNNDRIQIIRFPFIESDYNILKLIFHKLYFIVDNIKKENKQSEITIDVTATPIIVNYLITFIVMALSDRNTHIRIVYTSKGIESEPHYYAAKGSKYCSNEDLKLCDYRGMEMKDQGGETTFLELPLIDFQLFDVKNKIMPFLIALFRKIPGKDSQRKHNGIIYNELVKSDEKLINNYDESNYKDVEKTKKSLNIRITKGLLILASLGIIDLEKVGQKYYARKTWAGELIEPVVEDLYNFQR